MELSESPPNDLKIGSNKKGYTSNIINNFKHNAKDLLSR